MENKGLKNTIHYATTCLNVANAYRAAGEWNTSLKYYEDVKAVYDRMLTPTDSLYASYYNNLSLLYQEMSVYPYSQLLSLTIQTWLSHCPLPVDLHHYCAPCGCPVSSSVETVCGWFPCTGMTRAKVRNFHDSFPFCCTQRMVFWVSHSDAKHRRDFLHIEAPRLRYALN